VTVASGIERTRSPGDGARAFARFAWAVLGVTLAVVLWGAVVRATGSGAGCGSHWPLCNGAVLPQDPSQATIIEFVHRVGSGAALVLVAALWFRARRRFPGGVVRRWANAALVLILVEAGVGAGLVLMEWVGQDASAARAIAIALHLAVTYALLASLTLVGWHAPGREGVAPGIGRGATAAWVGGLIVIGMTGAVTALGDTLFPAATLAQGGASDFAAGSHFLVRLRVIHPVLAGGVGAALFVWAGRRAATVEGSSARRLSWLRRLVALQLLAGAINVVLLAPVWLQIVHLLLADLIWIVLVVCLAEAAGVATTNNGLARGGRPPATLGT